MRMKGNDGEFGLADTAPADVEERTPYEEMESVIFGMDPGDWATILVQKLLAASSDLRDAQSHLLEDVRDIDDKIDQKALADVRQKAALIVANVFEMLKAMPIMQMTPEALEGLHYVLTSIVDVERGSAPAWLVAKPTKAHPTQSTKRVQQMIIVTCVQLLRLLPAFKTNDAATKEIAHRCGTRPGTIKRWCNELHHPERSKVPAARDQIETEVMQIRAKLKVADQRNHTAIVLQRIQELLRR